MHYYQFNIGDYAKSTLHLTPYEDIAYRRLLDLAYDTEKPIPADIDKVVRLIRMREHKTETQQILDEFFYLTKKGYFQKRVKKELDAYSRKVSAARVNGKLGGRPKKTQSVNLANPATTQVKAKQEPLTINQEPVFKDIEPTVLVDAKTSTCPYTKIVDLYHKHFPAGPKVKEITPKRQKALKARWVNGASELEYWEDYFTHAATSPFLTGKNNRNWRADFDFFIRPDTSTFMQEGKYHK